MVVGKKDEPVNPVLQYVLYEQITVKDMIRLCSFAFLVFESRRFSEMVPDRSVGAFLYVAGIC
jgi:hypothetical protein